MSSYTAQSCCLESSSHKSFKFLVWRWCCHNINSVKLKELTNCVKVDWGGRLGLPVPNSPYGLCGRKATLNWGGLNFCDSAEVRRQREETAQTNTTTGMTLDLPSPWRYNRTGWLGVKHQVTYWTYRMDSDVTLPLVPQSRRREGPGHETRQWSRKTRLESRFTVSMAWE